MSNSGKRKERVALEESAHFGMLLKKLNVHVGKLGAAGNEHRQNPLLFMLRIFPVVLKNAYLAHMRKDRLKLLLGFSGELDHVSHSSGNAALHLDSNFRFLVCHNAGKSPVFGVLGLDLIEQTVGKHLRQV